MVFIPKLPLNLRGIVITGTKFSEVQKQTISSINMLNFIYESVFIAHVSIILHMLHIYKYTYILSCCLNASSLLTARKMDKSDKWKIKVP